MRAPLGAHTYLTQLDAWAVVSLCVRVEASALEGVALVFERAKGTTHSTRVTRTLREIFGA